jgi:predicted MFS family arabinose efflux permease
VDEREYRLLHVAAYMALFVVGSYAASFGPVLPFLAEDLNVSLDTAGLMLTALFFGSIVASASIAVVLHGRDMRALTALGRSGARSRCRRRDTRWRFART